MYSTASTAQLSFSANQNDEIQIAVQEEVIRQGKIEVLEKIFTINRLKTMQESDFFYAMFSSQFSESKLTKIDLKEISIKTASLMFDFFQNRALDLSRSSFRQKINLLEATNRFLCPNLKKICEIELGKAINKNTVLEIFDNSPLNFHHCLRYLIGLKLGFTIKIKKPRFHVILDKNFNAFSLDVLCSPPILEKIKSIEIDHLLIRKRCLFQHFRLSSLYPSLDKTSKMKRRLEKEEDWNGFFRLTPSKKLKSTHIKNIQPVAGYIYQATFKDKICSEKIFKKLIKNLKNLKKIQLEGKEYSDAHVEKLKDNCPRLETLALINCSVTNDGLKRLTPCFKNLKKLINSPDIQTYA